MDLTELDKLIDHRAAQARKRGEDERPAEASWKASVKRYNSAREAQRRDEWRVYHEAQAARHRRSLQALVAFHETRAQALLSEQSEPTEGRTP
jgi:hypothetical protein